MFIRGFARNLTIAALLLLAGLPAAAQHHSADTTPDQQISLSELLRVIQFYNTLGFHCMAGTEDGYAPGPDAAQQACAPHDSDYLPRDWNVNLTELLRLIQIFNTRGYHTECGTEDDFAPGTGGLFACGVEGEGQPEGVSEGQPDGAIEGQAEGQPEGSIEGQSEGIAEGQPEGVIEGEPEGVVEGVAEGEGEGVAEGEGEGEPEGEVTILLPGGVALEMVRIPAGSFQMGSPDTERSRGSDEGPVHPVTIGYDFYLGKYEVTQAQWLAVMGTAPYWWDYGVGDNYPAYYVSWNDAKSFVTVLNAHLTATGQGPATMRLPSEAEWEYACRAGTQTRFYFGDSLSVGEVCEDDGTRSQYLWYCGNNTPHGSKPVGGLLPNAFGLYDMSGSVREWCEDNQHDSYSGAPSDGSAWVNAPPYRIYRGGGWNSYARGCRSAGRSGDIPSRRQSFIGFRLAAVR
jgi:formylglycine-generating enzyme required for sulfatase activity